MEDKTERAIIKGKQAQQLLAEPLLQEAFEAIEHQAAETWKNSDPLDQEGRERVFLTVYALRKVREQFTAWANGGQLAEVNLVHEKMAKEFDRLNQSPGATS